jgi:imidazolonepropionase-like amidohydrolase
MRWSGHAALVLTLLTGCSEPPATSFVKAARSTFAISHVRVIDGTGAPARDDQTVLVRDGRITGVGSAATTEIPTGTAVISGRGRTVVPGLVGMHDHLFYELNDVPYESAAAFARLYLGAGVTTIRTAGAVDLDEDLRVTKSVDEGRLPGPKIHITSPYFGASDPATVAEKVETLANRGVTSFKAYTTMRLPELRALVDAAHARGLRVTGHLCAVGFRDAAAAGIDNLEHGLAVDTEFYSGKQLDVCPEQGRFMTEQMGMDPPRSLAVQQLVQYLVRHEVTVTSTLAVFESLTGDADVFDPRMPAVLTWRIRGTYDRLLSTHSDRTTPLAQGFAMALWHEMQFERMFVDAGGRLMAGADPTGWGGIVAGFADQRELELLVAAGFKPEAAIHIATENGAAFLNELDHIGTVRPGRQADLVLVRGNPATPISDVRNVEIVFKDGIGYDAAALVADSAGTVGEFDPRIFLRFPFNVILLALIALGCLDLLQRRRRRADATRSGGAGTPARPAATRARTPLQG